MKEKKKEKQSKYIDASQEIESNCSRIWHLCTTKCLAKFVLCWMARSGAAESGQLPLAGVSPDSHRPV